MGRDARLDVDHRHPVRHQVVQLPRDPQSLLGDPAPGLLLPGLLGAQNALLHLGEVGPAAPHRIAHRDRHHGPDDDVAVAIHGQAFEQGDRDPVQGDGRARDDHGRPAIRPRGDPVEEDDHGGDQPRLLPAGGQRQGGGHRADPERHPGCPVADQDQRHGEDGGHDIGCREPVSEGRRPSRQRGEHRGDDQGDQGEVAHERRLRVPPHRRDPALPCVHSPDRNESSSVRHPAVAAPRRPRRGTRGPRRRTPPGRARPRAGRPASRRS